MGRGMDTMGRDMGTTGRGMDTMGRGMDTMGRWYGYHGKAVWTQWVGGMDTMVIWIQWEDYFLFNSQSDLYGTIPQKESRECGY